MIFTTPRMDKNVSILWKNNIGVVTNAMGSASGTGPSEKCDP